MHLLVNTSPNQGQKPLKTLWKEWIVADSWLTQVMQMLREKNPTLQKDIATRLP